MNNQIAQMLMGRAPAQRPLANPVGAAVPQKMAAPKPRMGMQPQMGGMPRMPNMGAMQPPQPTAQPGQAQPVRGRDGRMYRIVVDPTTGLQTFTPHQGGMQ